MVNRECSLTLWNYLFRDVGNLKQELRSLFNILNTFGLLLEGVDFQTPVASATNTLSNLGAQFAILPLSKGKSVILSDNRP